MGVHIKDIETKGSQDKMDDFYSIDNLVTIAIIMDPDDWEKKILKARPRELPPPNSDGTQEGSHYDWVKATSLTISTSNSPEPITFTDVGVRKKSWAGSLSYKKPSLRVNFTKYNKDNKKTIKKLIGTTDLTLNNSKQDPAYIRQPLGYELFRQAGVPALRCNFASVSVNGQFWGCDPYDTLGVGDIVDPRAPPRDGVYVNVETLNSKKFVKHAFNNKKGNLYKLGGMDGDITPENVEAGRIEWKGFSKYSDRKDLLLAAQEIETYGLEGAKRVLDWDMYLRFLSMEILTNNWDGYNANLNNCFLYNDVKAVSDPKVDKDDINFKFIPTGIDQIIPLSNAVSTNLITSLPGTLTLADADETAKLYSQIQMLADQIFSEQNLDAVIYPYLDKAFATLNTANATLNPPEIDIVVSQIAKYRTWAYQMIGVAETEETMRSWCCSLM